MGRRDNLKIFTTAILVVLLLSSFIFAFIYRNEIYQKLQTIGKSKAGDTEDREIATKIPPPMLDSPSSENPSKDEVVTKLPDLPNLDDMEPETGKPRQVSVANGAEPKEKTADRSSLKEKMEKIDNSLDGKTDSKVVKDVGTDNVKGVSVPEKTKKRIEENVSTPTEKSEPINTKQISTKKVVKSQKTKWPTTYSKKEKRTYSSQISKKAVSPASSNSKLEARIRNVEETQRSQSQMYEKRFMEIEKRIQSLEKELAK